jgi:3-oxocholest-4-en-26-oate---CoA ligase
MREKSDWNYATVLREVAAVVPQNTAIVCGDRRVTFAQLDEASDHFAAALVARGFTAEEKIAIDVLNRPEYLIAFYGALKFGGVPVNINYRYKATELGYLLDYVDAAAVVVQEPFAAEIDAALADLQSALTRILVCDATPPSGDDLTFEALLDEGRAAPPASRRPTGDDLIFVCTGGTTGQPKAVMWRNDDLYVSQWQLSRPGAALRPPGEAMAAGKRAATTLPVPPLMHGTGLYAALGALSGGGTVVLIDQLGFDPERVWQAVDEHRVEVLVVVGDVFVRPLLAALADSPGEFDLSSLRAVSSSGAVFSPDAKAALLERVPGLRIIDSFGATEGMVSRVVSDDSESAAARFNVSDRVVVLAGGAPVAPGSGVVGALAVTGRLPLGYYKDPEKTAATFPTIDGVRYSVAGDLATVDASGTINFLGRGSATINTGGEKVFPEEVEIELRSMNGIIDCCVVGVPDERWGERVVAVVSADTTIDTAAMRETLRSRLAGYKVPKAIVVVPTLERGPNGKVDYRRIGEMAAQGTIR